MNELIKINYENFRNVEDYPNIGKGFLKKAADDIREINEGGKTSEGQT